MELKEEAASIEQVIRSCEVVKYLLNDLTCEPFNVAEEEIKLGYSANHGKVTIDLEFAPRTMTKNNMTILTFRLFQLFQLRFEENSKTVPNLAFSDDFQLSQYEAVSHEKGLKFTIYTPDLDT